MNRLLLISVSLLLISAPTFASTQKTLDRMKRQLDVLTDEIVRLKEKMVIPETDKLKSSFGLGPAASKVYGKKGLSIGGYGEFYLERKVKQKGSGFHTGDTYRFILYTGYKFTDWLVMNTELELEHGTTGKNYADKSGSISVEFSYLDFLLSRYANLRAGLMLIPMGFMNEFHEPPFYHGNFRPEVERQLIPSTWRELGIQVFGEITAGLTYKFWIVTGMNGTKFSKKGWRGARQKGARVLAESFGAGLNLQYAYGDLFKIGSSVYFGGADQNRIKGLHFNHLLAEARVQVRWQGLEFRALGVLTWLSKSKRVTEALLPDSSDLIATMMYGFYVELAYDFWPLISRSNMYLAPYVRFEKYNTQWKTPSITGRTADDSLSISIIDVGLTYKPHPQVVIKLNYRETFNAAKKEAADQLLLGAGFIF